MTLDKAMARRGSGQLRTGFCRVNTPLKRPFIKSYRQASLSAARSGRDIMADDTRGSETESDDDVQRWRDYHTLPRDDA